MTMTDDRDKVLEEHDKLYALWQDFRAANAAPDAFEIFLRQYLECPAERLRRPCASCRKDCRFLRKTSTA